MNSKFYKCCIVPKCESTTMKTPNKLFIDVPNKEAIRKKWLKLARRDPGVSTDSRMYFCEDHFNLPTDMENFMEYDIKGFVSQIRLKPNFIPTKFDCQPDRRKRTPNSLEGPCNLKKQKMLMPEECSNEVVECLHEGVECLNEEVACSNEAIESGIILQEAPKTADKSVQVLMTHKYRSKTTQVDMKVVDQAVSPFKLSHKTVSTSPFKLQHNTKLKPSSSGISKITKKILIEEHSDSDVSSYKPAPRSDSSPSTQSLQVKSSSDCSELVEEKEKQQSIQTIRNTTNKIMMKPRFYIGVPKNCYFLIDLITNETNIPLNHLLLCLKKIRLDTKFEGLADDFSMSSSYVSKIFLKNIPIIASVMRPFIVTLDSQTNRKTLPMAFRHKYHNVSCIIDCLEIEVQNPSKAVNQALTWSDYKKANTVKYLISCTPSGLVNYISPGFGGRTTDTCIVESCDFVQCLGRGMCVMADRGFKHVQQYLQKSGVQLVRPPSVKTGVKLTKHEAKQTKRIHVERVIRHLREFNMLKPHACININFVKVLDDIITLACGLIYLQNSLIK